MALERLQKILSASGACSRREAEELILTGRVRVNGKVVTELGTKADPETDVIKLGGRSIRPGGQKSYLLMNKPKGFVSTLKDPQNRKTVIDLLRKGEQRVYPVGRLDYDTEGLLLLTNDGEFSNAVMHPSRKIEKTYEVKVHGVLTDEKIRRLAAGVRLADGMTAPAKVRKLKLTDKNSWIELTIHEGRNKQVRRMCDEVGHTVLKLRRTKVGTLTIRGVPPGKYRELTPSEVKSILKLAGYESKAGAGKDGAVKVTRAVKPQAGKPARPQAEGRPGAVMPSRTGKPGPARPAGERGGSGRPRPAGPSRPARPGGGRPGGEKKKGGHGGRPGGGRQR